MRQSLLISRNSSRIIHTIHGNTYKKRYNTRRISCGTQRLVFRVKPERRPVRITQYLDIYDSEWTTADIRCQLRPAQYRKDKVFLGEIADHRARTGTQSSPKGV